MSRITKKTVAIVIALVLAFALTLATVTAYAGQTTVSAYSSGDAPVVAINAGINERVRYGEKLTVPAAADSKFTAKVVTPGGREITGDLSNITADELGIYRIYYTYTDGGTTVSSYYYNVECYMDYEYKLLVDGNGSAIPGFVEREGGSVQLPSATLYYLDEETDEWLPVNMDAENELSKVYCRVTAPDGTTTLYNLYEEEAGTSAWGNGATLSNLTLGTYFVTYYAELAGGKNTQSVQYTMQVREQFSDTGNPTINVSGLPRSISIGTKVTLPAATVGDNYDERVGTSIRVTHVYSGQTEATDVRAAVIDPVTGYAVKDSKNNYLYYLADTDNEYGYAYYAKGDPEIGTEGWDGEAIEAGDRKVTTNVTEAVVVRFDNSDFMSFYPTESGSYTAVYQVSDSSGNTSAPHEYRMTAADTTAPVVKDFDTSIIPTTWGRNTVKKYSESETDGEAVLDRKVAFPIPELIDNLDSGEDLRVSFVLTDPNRETIISITDIYETEYSAAVTSSNSNYDGGKTYALFRYWDYEGDGKYTVAEDGRITGPNISGDVYSLVKHNDDGTLTGLFDYAKTAVNRTGKYSVSYTMRDSVGNNSTQTFTTDVRASFSDLTNPIVSFETPSSLAFRDYDTEESIDDVRFSDNDSRLGVEYYLVYGSVSGSVNTEEPTTEDFDNLKNDLTEGEEYIELDYSSGTNALSLTYDKGEYFLEVTDSDGKLHKIDAADLDTLYVAGRATDDVGNVSVRIQAIDVVTSAVFSGNDLTDSDVTISSLDVSGVPGEQLLVGSASINYKDAALRNYTGFELYVQRVLDSKGNEVTENPLSNVAFETYSMAQDGNYTIHADNIRFTPSVAGTYMVVFRAYNVMGDSVVKVMFADVVSGGESGGATTSAASSLPSTLEVGRTYKLTDSYNVDPADYAGSVADSTYGIVRSIRGGKVSIVGNELTAYSVCSYSLTDYTFLHSATASGTNNISGNISYSYVNTADNSPATGNLAGVTTGSANYNYVGIFTPNVQQGRTDYVNASDTTTAAFQLQGVMPTYSALWDDAWTAGNEDKPNVVILPNISAYSPNAAAEDIDIEITDADGNAPVYYMAKDKESMDDTYKAAVAKLTGKTGTDLSGFYGNMAMFVPTEDGVYTITYTATLNNQTVTTEYTISAGDVIAPTISVDVGSINGRTQVAADSVSASVGSSFDFASITVENEPTTGFTFKKELIDPSGATVATITSQNLANNGSSYELSTAGQYTVQYTVTDAAGNSISVKYTIVVSSSSVSNPSSGAVTTLAVVLIIVGVILIAGVVIYLIRFRKRKPNGGKK